MLEANYRLSRHFAGDDLFQGDASLKAILITENIRQQGDVSAVGYK